MGLTNKSTGITTVASYDIDIVKTNEDDKVIAIAGNPNVGKSTVFNALTGARQHTGNWPGKTVEQKEGEFRYNGKQMILADLPGSYSLSA